MQGSGGWENEPECRSPMQGWKQSSGIDLKRQLTEVAAASLALPGPLSSDTLRGSEPSTFYAGGASQSIGARWDVFT